MTLCKTFHVDILNVSSKTTYHLTDDGFQKDYCIHIAGLLLEEPDEVDAVPDAKYEKFIGKLNKSSIYSHRLAAEVPAKWVLCIFDVEVLQCTA